MNTSLNKFIGTKLRPTELALFTKWLLRIKRVIIATPNKLNFYIDPISSFGLNLQEDEIYEPQMSQKILAILKEGDAFIDLGANEGYFSIVASKTVGNFGKVFAIEPQQRLWEVITKNASINSCNNIQLLPFGIGAEKSEATINLYSTLNTGASSFAKNFNFKISMQGLRKWFYGKQKIFIEKLDNLIDIFPKTVKLIKIDIEGFEYEALKGMQNILSKGIIEHLLIETHQEALVGLGQSEADIITLLKNHNYDVERLEYNLLFFSLKN